MLQIVFSLVVIAYLADMALATTRLVPEQYPTIQRAMLASTFGDVIEVAPGVHRGAVAFNALSNGVRLVSTSGPNVTFIEPNPGQFPGTAVTLDGVGDQTSIEGFTIRQPPDMQDVGNAGGMYVQNSRCVIRGNIIERCRAQVGGGIFVWGGAPKLQFNIRPFRLWCG